jgi:signal peptidase I
MTPVAGIKSGQTQAQIETQKSAQILPEPQTLTAETHLPQATHPHRHHSHHNPTVLTAMQSLFNLIIIAIFIITFCAQPFRIPSESMESTLLVGDFLLVNKQSAAPSADGSASLLPSSAIHRGDIIVFHDPVDSSLHLVKRVIGLPGDHLRLRAGRVFINGHELTEPYAVYRPSPPDNFRDNFPRFQSADPEIDSHWWIRMRSLIENGELIIPTGNYFVMGDNRNDSEDSRYWGFVPREAIVGEPLLVYFSLQQHDDDSAALTQQALAADQRRQHPSRIDSLVDFARWGRTFQVIR